jgi:plastocyanin
LSFDAQGQPVAGAVLSLSGPAQAKSKSPQRSWIRSTNSSSPAVLAVATGTAVSFPNRDDIRHQVYSFSPAKRFELRLYEGTPSAPVTFDRPGLVMLGCNIHDWMLGYVYVTDDPMVRLSATQQGRIQLDAPAGQYRSDALAPGAWLICNLVDAGHAAKLGEAPVELKLLVAGALPRCNPRLQPPTAFADAFRKATRDAQP